MPLKTDVALVIDALPGLGGAEKVLMAVMELFPEAPIYTLVYHRAAFKNTPITQRQVFTSYLDKLPFAQSQYRKFLPLMPYAIEQFDFTPYERVISFSYAVAHGIKTVTGQKHYSYTFTPMRYAWRYAWLNGRQETDDRLTAGLFYLFRLWDQSVVKQIDSLASVSGWIREAVQRVYRRESQVIYPPVDVGRFKPQSERQDYYISVARLFAHKQVDKIVAAFNRLKLPLLVVGEGPERSRLAAHAGPNVRFLGYQSDEMVASLLSRARGYVSATEEDFGISMVEAQAAGCPVVAYGLGGALETVRPGETGLFFQEPTVEAIAEAVLRFESSRTAFDALHIADHAQAFNKRRFLKEFSAFCNMSYRGWSADL